jgi:dTDP-4-dehydrorhamnose reductase
MLDNPERVLITGCGGMLGNAIYPYFERRCRSLFATDKLASGPWMYELDVRDEDALAEAFREIRPDLVLHLAAETDLEFCETHPDVAEATNASATRTIGRLAESFDTTLVYISTAGVFDGEKEGFYTEADAPRPIMVYGRTKLEGEDHVRALCRRHYVVRAGWMVGGGPRKDHKFVSKILEQVFEGRRLIHAVADKLGTPTYTHDFAMNLFRLLASGCHGTYHMACEGHGSRYDVAREIVAICGRPDIEVRPVDSSFFDDLYFAPRPRSEMMWNANLKALGINLMRPWKEALRDYILREYAAAAQEATALDGLTLADQATGFPAAHASDLGEVSGS